MPDIDRLRSAALEMRKDRDTRWHAVADWLDAEAVTLGGMEPLTELLNVAYQNKTGKQAFLKFLRTDDGEIELRSDTSPAAFKVIRAYLGDEEARDA